MERFLPSAGGSSAAALKPCGEPTCQSKSTLVSGVHQCPCGRFMHAFCGRGIGGEGFGQQRECSDCQKRKGGDQAGSSISPMEVDAEENEQDSRSTMQPFRGEEPSVGGKGKRPAADAGVGGSAGKRAAPGRGSSAGGSAGGSAGWSSGGSMMAVRAAVRAAALAVARAARRVAALAARRAAKRSPDQTSVRTSSQ
ncbi:unnamed protein product [Pylaiella littoralis]